MDGKSVGGIIKIVQLGVAQLIKATRGKWVNGVMWANACPFVCY